MKNKAIFITLFSISSLTFLCSCKSTHDNSQQSNSLNSSESHPSTFFPDSYNSTTDIMDGILYYKENELSIMEGEINLWTNFGVDHDEQTSFGGKLFSFVKIPNVIPDTVLSSLVAGDHFKYKSNQVPHIRDTYPAEIYLDEGDVYLGYEIVSCSTIKVKVNNGLLLTNEYPGIDFSYIQISRFALDKREDLIPLVELDEAYVSLSLTNPSLARAIYTYNPHP